MCRLCVCGLAVMFALTAVGAGENVPPKLNAEVSWVGNSFNGNPAWVPQDIDALYVTPEGDIFTNIGWEEGGGNVTYFDRDGNWKGFAGHTHGWGNKGGEAVGANSKYLFIGGGMENGRGSLNEITNWSREDVINTWPPKGKYWIGVSRRPRENIRKGAPFPGGKGGAGDTLRDAFCVVEEITEEERSLPESEREALRGIVATDQYLYVSLRKKGQVIVFDAETMERVKTFSLPRADRLAFAPDGRLWTLQPPTSADNPWSLIGLNADTGAVENTTVFPLKMRPNDLAFAPDGILYVNDESDANQITVWNGLTGAAPNPQLTKRLGAERGIHAGPVPGAYGPMRFHRPRAVGVDGAGNLYVANDGSIGGGGTVLESYAPDGTPRWQRFGLHFADVVDLDPETMQIYSTEEIFTLDLSKPAGEQWNYLAYTCDPQLDFDDARVKSRCSIPTAWHRRLDGHSFVFMAGVSTPFLAVYRFDQEKYGYNLIPAALFSRYKITNERDKRTWPANEPETGGWRWHDANGDGKMQKEEFAPNDRDANVGRSPLAVDDAGRIWWSFRDEVRSYGFINVDANGVPTWDWEHPTIFPRPDEFDELRRVFYDAASNRLLLGGAKGDDKNQHWKPMGPIVSMYEGVVEGEPRLVWTQKLPYVSGTGKHESREPMGFAIAGDYVFVSYVRGIPEEDVAYAFVKVLRLDTGEVVGNLDSSPVTGDIGLLDVEDALTVRRLDDGRYVIFLEDDYKAKDVMFIWKP